MKSMPFAEFLKNVNTSICSTSDSQTTTFAVRQHLRTVLQDNEFLIDCVNEILNTLDTDKGWLRFPVIHRDKVHCYTICIFYWPPGFVNTPHKHNHWTVTGVMHNNLRFRTFRLRKSENTELIPEKQIDAGAGDVGYICTPCIHDVGNVTNVPAMSFHIFSHSNGAIHPDELTEYPLEGSVPQPALNSVPALSELFREDVLCVCAQVLGKINDSRTCAVLDQIFERGADRARMEAIKAMSVFDLTLAAKRARELSSQLPNWLGVQLFRISEEILHNARRTRL